ncbi:MAG: DUF3800 domain-containing protein [Sediminibacterium sp.]
MYLMYVDESGDPGISEGSSEHYILTALVIYHTEWEQSLSNLKRFRRQIQELYGLDTHTEIHATELLRIKKQEAYKSIPKAKRIQVLKRYAESLPEIFPNAVLLTVNHIKQFDKSDDTIPEKAWQELLVKYQQFLSGKKEKGMLIADEGNERRLRNMLRNLRKEISLNQVIEDFSHRSSKASYFIQTVDVIAFLLYKKTYPKGSAKKYNLDLLFDRFSALVLD